MSLQSTKDTLELALDHHQAGRLREAEEIYRQVLAREPDHVISTHYLGVIAYESGQHDVAVNMIGKAIALDPNYAEAHIDLGNVLKDSGRLDEAIASFSRVSPAAPSFPEAQLNLGVALNDKGQPDEAMAAFHRAIDADPAFPQAYFNLANMLSSRGRFDEAVTAYRQAIAAEPDFPEAWLVHTRLGHALKALGKLDESIAAFRQATARRPNDAEAHNDLGVALRQNGKLDDAVAAYRRAISIKPDYAEAHSNLGVALARQGLLDDAIAAYRQAIGIRPDYAEAHNNLGIALTDKGQLDEAIAACRRAIAIRPDYPEAHNGLGVALTDKGDLDEAISAYRRAITLRPDYFAAHSNLGNVLKDGGRLEEAIATYRGAVNAEPQFAEAHSNLICTMHFHSGCDTRDIAGELRRWDRQHAEPLKKFIRPHANDRDPDRRLHIGYVSPDFRDHVVGRNILPLIRRHDQSQFEVTCYSQVACPDGMTGAFQQSARRWRNIVGLSDEQAAEQIRRDEIDVLVDLTLHMAYNRLLVFARKPAPVQVTFAGYPGSTGLTTIDYRLSDPYLDPARDEDRQINYGLGRELSPSLGTPGEGGGGGVVKGVARNAPSLTLPRTTEGGNNEGIRSSCANHDEPPDMDESVYSEKTIRLPDSFWCYDPLDCADISVNSPPALQTGILTFGSFNNFCKVTDATLGLWAQVLRQVEGSRLLLMAQPGSHRQRTVERLSRDGIDAGRVEFVSKRPRRDYLALYHRVDIGLDTFPYNGHTTSLDSFWMGVPVVTLVGRSAVARAGWCQLSNLGLTELSGQTPDQFVRIAVELARDLPRLTRLRATLRERMEQSPLMDAPRFARNIEAAYRRMWRTWCVAGSGQ